MVYEVISTSFLQVPAAKTFPKSRSRPNPRNTSTSKNSNKTLESKKQEAAICLPKFSSQGTYVSVEASKKNTYFLSYVATP